jgi:hypothetical protein
MRLARIFTALLLGSSIGFSTTCGSLDLGGRGRPLAADAPPAAEERVPGPPRPTTPPGGP